MGIDRSGENRYIICTSGTRPSNPSEGTMIYETDTDRVYIYDNANWRIPGIRYGQIIFAANSAAASVGNTSSGVGASGYWRRLFGPPSGSSGAGGTPLVTHSNYTNTYDILTLPAVAGDVIDVEVNGLTGKNGATGSTSYHGLDVIFMDGSSNFLTFLSTNSSYAYGATNILGDQNSIYEKGCLISYRRALVSGDISSGQVNMRLVFNQRGSVAAYVWNDSTYNFVFRATNLGPAV